MTRYFALLAGAALLAAPAIAKDKEEKKTAPNAAVPGTVILFHGQNLDGDWKLIDQDSPDINTYWTVGSIAVPQGETWTICQSRVYKGNCMDLSANMTELGKVDIKSAKKKP